MSHCSLFFQESEQSESDPELQEPQTKRRRLAKDRNLADSNLNVENSDNSEEDIIPFGESDYERIIDKSGTAESR